VADRGEQGGALIDVALNPVAHGHEGHGGGADLFVAYRRRPGIEALRVVVEMARGAAATSRSTAVRSRATTSRRCTPTGTGPGAR
jgi:hypothetical protein